MSAVIVVLCPDCLKPLREVDGCNLDACPKCGEWYLVENGQVVCKVP